MQSICALRCVCVCVCVHVCVRVCVRETHLERNCTATQTPAYMRPLMSQESMSKSAMKPTSQMTTKGVPSITFCLNSYSQRTGRRQMDRDGKSGETAKEKKRQVGETGEERDVSCNRRGEKEGIKRTRLAKRWRERK